MKKTIGPDVTLMVDFNQALSVAEAMRSGRMIDDEGGVLWIEEPMRADDFSGCSEVRREVRTPIQIGENFMGPEQMAQARPAAVRLRDAGCAQRIGEVSGWMRAAALASRRARGVEPPLSRVSTHLPPLRRPRTGSSTWTGPTPFSKNLSG